MKRVNPRATITQEQARALQAAIFEGQYAFGLDGQLNITIPRLNAGKADQESIRTNKKRAEGLATQIVEHLGADPKAVSASKGRIVVKNPNQDMPYIFAELNIPVEWKAFAKGVELSKSPAQRPSGNAVVTSYATEMASLKSLGMPMPPSASPKIYASTIIHLGQGLPQSRAGFRPPTTWVGKVLLSDALGSNSGHSRA